MADRPTRRPFGTFIQPILEGTRRAPEVPEEDISFLPSATPEDIIRASEQSADPNRLEKSKTALERAFGWEGQGFPDEATYRAYNEVQDAKMEAWRKSPANMREVFLGDPMSYYRAEYEGHPLASRYLADREAQLDAPASPIPGSTRTNRDKLQDDLATSLFVEGEGLRWLRDQDTIKQFQREIRDMSPEEKWNRVQGYLGADVTPIGSRPLAAAGTVPGDRLAQAAAQGFDVENILYHGTKRGDIEEFRIPGERGAPRAVFLTPNKDVANRFAGGEWTDNRGGNVIPVFVRGNMWDYENPENVSKIVDRLSAELGRPSFDEYVQLPKWEGEYSSLTITDTLEGLEEKIKGGDWQTIEHPLVQQIIKDQGFDGFYVNEYGKNVGVFDPANIRSVNAAFDPEKSQSSKLLAGAGGATVAATALAPEEAEAVTFSPGAQMARRQAEKVLGTGARRTEEGERVAQRGKRDLAERPVVTASERELIRRDKPEDVPMNAMEESVRNFRRRFPRQQWAQPRLDKFDEQGRPQWATVGYNFHIDPKTGREASRNSNHFKNISNNIADEIISIYRAAEEGDPAAIRIMGNQGWYKNVQGRLRSEFGSFAQTKADTLGATSPQTDVATNFRYSEDLLRRMGLGEFDEVMDGIADTIQERDLLLDSAEGYLAQQRAAGRTKKAAAQDPEYQNMIEQAKGLSGDLQRRAETIRKENGTKYGANNYNVLIALADEWNTIRKGSAPKARNFSQNFTGRSLAGTIDVWSARNVRRHAGMKPIPPAAEGAVKGNVVDPENFISSSEFGFAQDALEAATKRVNAELGLDLDPRDMQALQWFAEKDLWARNGWTSVAGEGGSVETMLDISPTEYGVIGISRERPNFKPTPADQAEASRAFVQAASLDPDIRAFKAKSSLGKFDEDEISLDVEAVVPRDTVPSDVLDQAARQAVADNQDSIFFARRIKDEVATQTPENYQVGAELYLRDGVDANSDVIADIQDALNEKGIQGFTLIMDPRPGINKAIGVRFLDIPQFYNPAHFARMSKEAYGEHVAETFSTYEQIATEISRSRPEIQEGGAAYYDVNVKSRPELESYVAQLESSPMVGAAPGADPGILREDFWGFKPARTRFAQFNGEIRPYYSAPGEGAGGPGGGGGRVTPNQIGVALTSLGVPMAMMAPSIADARDDLSALREHAFRNIRQGKLVFEGDQVASVRSGSVEDERLNQGRPTLIPFQWEGELLEPDEAIERAIESGKQWPAFDTNEAAKQASIRLSDQIADMTEMVDPVFPEFDPGEDVEAVRQGFQERRAARKGPFGQLKESLMRELAPAGQSIESAFDFLSASFGPVVAAQSTILQDMFMSGEAEKRLLDPFRGPPPSQVPTVRARAEALNFEPVTEGGRARAEMGLEVGENIGQVISRAVEAYNQMPVQFIEAFGSVKAAQAMWAKMSPEERQEVTEVYAPGVGF